MTENISVMGLDSFIAERVKVIRNKEVFIDSDIAELFETDTETIYRLVESNPDLFPEEAMLALNCEERMHLNNVRYAFGNAGIFALAGLLKSKRSIRIYVKLIELLVNKLQGKAFELAASYQGNI
ncbi:MAG: ORF6N domain-containing protein [Bacteroidales bacterium]|nr:ORF6N domain-containing protein [Bacteroidales bacterium]